MAMDLTDGGAADLAIREAVKDGMLEAYKEKAPSEEDMDQLARGIAPGILKALIYLRDNAETVPSGETVK
jgi:hypothetical protein